MKQRYKDARRLFVLLLLFVIPAILQAESRYDLVKNLMSDDDGKRKEAAKALIELHDISLVPAMVDALFFTPRKSRDELIAVLENWTGEKPGKGYYEWLELVGRRTDLKPGHDYLQWKVALLSKIDPFYRKLLYREITTRIRFEEIVWGGVTFDGIPSLEFPPSIPASAASYLKNEEKIFGISLGEESRAYPLRILSWHELLNDRIGGEPVTLSY